MTNNYKNIPILWQCDTNMHKTAIGTWNEWFVAWQH